MTGMLALVGGDEFHPGNEPHDERLVAAAAAGPAYVMATAAQDAPDRAVAVARTWFAGLGLDVVELPARTRRQASDAGIVARAREGRLFHLCGGDPGAVVSVLRDTPLWAAIVAAWRDGAALAGSSAGAMALCRWTLLRDTWPGHDTRRWEPALLAVPGVDALLPHFSGFGRRWVRSARAASPVPDPLLLGVDERTALLWDGVRWQVTGAGVVTVIHAGDERVYTSGDNVDAVGGLA